MKYCLLDVMLPPHKTCIRSSQPDRPTSHQAAFIEFSGLQKPERTWRGGFQGIYDQDTLFTYMNCQRTNKWYFTKKKKKKRAQRACCLPHKERNNHQQNISRFSSDTHLPVLWSWNSHLPEMWGVSVLLQTPGHGVLCQQPQCTEVAGVWHHHLLFWPSSILGWPTLLQRRL